MEVILNKNGVQFYSYPDELFPDGAFTIEARDGKWTTVIPKEEVIGQFILFPVKKNMYKVVSLKNIYVSASFLEESRVPYLISHTEKLKEIFGNDVKIAFLDFSISAELGQDAIKEEISKYADKYDVIICDQLKKFRIKINNNDKIFKYVYSQADMMQSYDDYLQTEIKVLQQLFSNEKELKELIDKEKTRIQSMSKSLAIAYDTLISYEIKLKHKPDILKELSNIDFEWEVGFNGKTLSFITKPIYTVSGNKKYLLGKYVIVIDVESKTVADIVNLWFENTHPHVRSYICWGSFADKVTAALAKGELRVLCDILNIFLTKINLESMFPDNHITKYPEVEELDGRYVIIDTENIGVLKRKDIELPIQTKTDYLKSKKRLGATNEETISSN